MNEARPHPTLALGSSDFSDDAEFTASIINAAVKIFDGSLKFKVLFKCNVSSVNGYLKRGALSYGLRAKCMGTSYSDFISADSDELTVKIPANYLDGDLELLAVIYAKETFDFSPSGINKDFDSHIFKVPKGGQVGLFELPKIPIDHRIDYQKPLSSIIDVKQIEDPDVRNARLDKENNRLTIELPKETYDLWHSLRQQIYPLRNAMANILVAPVIIDAVHYLISIRDEGLSDYEDLLAQIKWAKQLDKILDEVGFSVQENKLDKKENVFEAVDKILSGPIEKTIKNLHDFTQNED